MANLFAKKPLARLMEEAQEVGEHSLKRSLGPINLIALGIGGIIGAGLFVRTAAAIADRAGPSVVLAFIVAGIGCAFAGLCYAEFASMIPVAGSAYTYSYATMGEFVAGFINPANHTPMIPAPTTYITGQGITHAYGGILGILGAAGVVFFAYIGFDAVSTAAQETRNPKRDMPIGILGSLAFCTILYVLFSYVLSGVATVGDFRAAGREASVAFAISKYMHGYEWLSKSVTVAILAGFSSVILVMLLGQSRVFFSMSRDGLVPQIFSDVHPRYRTPYKSNMLFFVFTGLLAAFVPADVTGEMTSIGTLFAFILVCAGIWIMRVRSPELERGFRVPAAPLVCTLGIIVCGAMIYGLGWTNWMRLIIWLIIGFFFYFGYGKSHSRINAPPPEMPEGIKLTR